MKQRKQLVRRFFAVMSLSTVSVLWSLTAYAEVVFDHSAIVSAPLQGQKLSGSMRIPASAGTQVGGNLFHSFQTFNIHSGESATFTNVGATSAISNVIGRVTGGFASQINGMLRSTIPHAALYLLNPQGIVFGANASLDVQGSFHASTASALALENNGLFSAYNNNDTVLSSAPPQAFGFLDSSATPQTISVNGATLSVTANKTLDLTAGAVTIKQGSTLAAPAGEIRLLAKQGTGWLDINKAGNVTPTANNSGDISISDKSFVDASGDGSGRVSFWGNQIALSDSYVFADNTGTNDASLANGVVMRGYDITINNSPVTSDVLSSGHAGNINVTATNRLSIEDGGQIKSDVYADGDASNVAIKAGTLDITNQNNSSYTGVFSNTYKGKGHAGAITVNAGKIHVVTDESTIPDQNSRSFMGIFSNTYNGSAGNAGSIKINADNLAITANASTTTDQNSNSFVGVFSNVYEGSLGNAGRITLNIAHALTLHKYNSLAFTGVFSETFNDNNSLAGALNIHAQLLRIFDGTFISSSTRSAGNAGNVNVVANKILINGNNGQNLTGIVSDAYRNSGNAGNVKVRASTLDLLDSAHISSSTYAQGSAGHVVVAADTLTINDQNSDYLTGISSDAYETSRGDAKTVTVTAKNLAILNGGQIGSNSYASGNAGSVAITADKLTIDTENSADFTGVFSVATQTSTGDAGDINIQVSDETLLNRSQINSSLFGRGSSGGTVELSSPRLTVLNESEISALADSVNRRAVSGNVNIKSTQFTLDNNSQITAVNVGFGNAGAIAITAKDALLVTRNSGVTVQSDRGNAGDIHVAVGQLAYLLDSQLSTTAASGKGNGGNILFDPPSTFVVLNNSQITANALAGHGGNIDIFTHFFLQSAESAVQASSQFGLQGKVSINSANSNIAGSIAVLPSIFIDSSNLLQGECNQQSKQTASSFTAFSVHGAVLASPDNVLNYMPSSLLQCSAVF